MKRRSTKIERALEISIYLKSNDKADVVFRKKNVLYRIGILGANGFLISLGNYLMDLQKALKLQLEGGRMRRWILEMGCISDDHAVLQVWEMVAGEMKSCFKWAGTALELQFSVRR